MYNTSPSFSPRQAALIAGFAYLAVFIVATFAQFALDKIIVQGDAAATAKNIMDSGLLFRLGISGWIIVLLIDAVVAWALYLFLKPVNDGLALLAAWFRLLFVAIFAGSFFNLFAVMELLSGTGNLAAIEPVQLHAQITPFLAAYDIAVHISFVPFGLHILVVGYLIFKSGSMPRILGILLMVAAAGYQIDSFGNFISSAYGANEINFIIFVAIPAVVSELWLTLWLLVKGGRGKP
ncbi:MAG: DUF4386 domain-containing protein [SAR324 cluster bacterium]|nr:DUF4386 domain-containing protein [SAR324 cluster bacterium]